MNKDEVIAECVRVLEGLRDNALIHNEGARGQINRTIAHAAGALGPAVAVEPATPETPAVQAPVETPEPETPIAPSLDLGEERSEERDPGEDDQHLAEALKLTPEPEDAD